MLIQLDRGALQPERGHANDAGLDLRNHYEEPVVIKAHSSAFFDTGVHILIPKGYVGFIKSKSGLNVYHGITADGVIDAGYTGSIVVKLYNHSDDDYTVEYGHKIAQLVFLPIVTPSLELCDFEDLKTERGSNGFGSTGV